MATAETTRRTRGVALRGVARGAWAGSALFWSAFGVLEGVNHGWFAGLAALFGLLAPDLTMLVGVREAAATAHGQLPPKAVPYYNALHRATVPLALVVAYSFGPLDAPALFAALCGWLAHISYDRAFGYGLRTKEGFQRA